MTDALKNPGTALDDDAKLPLGGRKPDLPIPTADDLSKMTPAQQETALAQQRQQGENDQVKKNDKGGSLKINIALDLDIELHLTARIKGDIQIGLL